jgi:hypothetical protein
MNLSSVPVIELRVAISVDGVGHGTEQIGGHGIGVEFSHAAHAVANLRHLRGEGAEGSGVVEGPRETVHPLLRGARSESGRLLCRDVPEARLPQHSIKQHTGYISIGIPSLTVGSAAAAAAAVEVDVEEEKEELSRLPSISTRQIGHLQLLCWKSCSKQPWQKVCPHATSAI